LFALEPVLRTQQKFNSRLQLSERQLNHVNEIIHDLMRETQSHNPGYRIMAKGLFMQLAVYLSRCCSDEPSEESLNLLRLGDAIAHNETSFAEKITLGDLAKKAHLSSRHFQRIFRECMGRSPIDHLLHVRIQKATELLRHSNRTITEIAFECGFSDSNYFSRQFKQIMNQSAARYRSDKR
jgi:transcriptional regulator GlxA family with amidase domain